ncbi:MAG: isopentenyl-diphosphate Delta-isomerase [Corynebacterium sp.]|nr:isopentenyl-diphosphate Delta-isomerase [Corynebacterium sp.]
MVDGLQQPAEQVVLVDEAAAARGVIAPIGTALKATVHTDHTPLHLAFSCYLVNSAGEVLVTRRALTKTAWPGVWTNTMCGHPGPGEDPAAALVRRGTQELGLPAAAITGVTEVLPLFTYRATDSRGIVEWEVCPTFVAHCADTAALDPDPAEVDSVAWVDPADLIRAVRATPFAFSPWCGQQLSHAELLSALGQ